MGDTVTMAIYAIGGLALLPLAVSIISSIRSSRRERRRAAMFDRFYDRIGQ